MNKIAVEISSHDSNHYVEFDDMGDIDMLIQYIEDYPLYIKLLSRIGDVDRVKIELEDL